MDKADKPDLLQSTRRPSKCFNLALSCEVNRQGQRNRAIRIRYPEFILVVIIVVSEARYKTLHLLSHRKLSKWVGVVDNVSSYQPEGRGFESRLAIYLFSSHFFRVIVWILLKSSRQPRDIKYILYMQHRKAQCVELNWQPLL